MQCLFRDGGHYFTNCKWSFRVIQRPLPESNSWHIRKERDRMMRDRASTWVCGEPQVIFSIKNSALLNRVGPCIICTNNEFLPIDIRAEQKQFYDTIITILLGTNSFVLWKGIDDVKSQRIRCNPKHHLGSWIIYLDLSDYCSFGWMQICSRSVVRRILTRQGW
jgi:hypothetical protein